GRWKGRGGGGGGKRGRSRGREVRGAQCGTERRRLGSVVEKKIKRNRGGEKDRSRRGEGEREERW
ncbi:hypothetical protein, partial [Escherichia coli]|uniref:hypothetical protein n=1 Tax=Escherichia coli TaxID=562 RepID=UPI0016497D74